MKKYYSNGKLLLTAEYFVLDGAKALALPSKFGQSLEVVPLEEPTLIWQSFNIDGTKWLEVVFRMPDLRITSETFTSETEENTENLAKRLRQILLAVKELNPLFLADKKGYLVKNQLTFDKNWGLGTSSTLINNLSQWANVNPYALLQKTFGGSGYDIACAKHNTPVLYHLKEGENVKEISFLPKFSQQLYFVYLNKKQNSRTGIKHYKKYKKDAFLINEISEITQQIIKVTTIKEFESLLQLHEEKIAKALEMETVQSRLFSDYFGQTKSLGAWGGDFVLATGNNQTPQYFKDKGFHIVIPYNEMIK